MSNPFLSQQLGNTNQENKNKLVIDFSNLVIITVTSVFKTEQEQQELTGNQVKTVVLHQIKDIVKKYKNKYSEVIIAVDNTRGGSYKKDFAPYYKAHRSAGREKSSLNWDIIFDQMKVLENELQEVFGYKVISISRLEADDIIGYISTKGNSGEYNTMIISTDGDFKQLHSKFTKQYSISKGKQVEPDINPKADLIVKIIKGDAKDAVSPLKVQSTHTYNNIMKQSELNEVKRAPSIKKDELEMYCAHKSLESLRTIIPVEFLDRFDENVKLLDLTILPEEYQQKIEDKLKEVNNQTSKSKIYSYLLSNGLTKLLDSIQDF